MVLSTRDGWKSAEFDLINFKVFSKYDKYGKYGKDVEIISASRMVAAVIVL